MPSRLALTTTLPLGKKATAVTGALCSEKVTKHKPDCMFQILTCRHYAHTVNVSTGSECVDMLRICLHWLIASGVTCETHLTAHAIMYAVSQERCNTCDVTMKM